ncbi:hypothetical protein ACEPAH_7468 [Sanghuangporus vaninii]
MGVFISVSTALDSWCILLTHILCCDVDMSGRISSDSTVVDLPLTAERAFRNSFASEPILNQWDHEELRQLERRSEHSYAGMLHALLDWHSDLDLTGKVHGIDTSHPIPGGYSDIMLGYCTRSDGTEYKVAVKRLRLNIMQDSEFQKKLAKELYIWSKLKNSRILPLEGFYLENNNYPSLVSRWMENGTVLKYLESNSNTDLLKLIIGIAEGITYLHLNDIVHSDIKPDNVVISDAGEPLLCDFGVSRMLGASRSYNFSSSLTGGLRGTIRFMSKELLQTTESAPAKYSKASDVWAFGMTVLSILTKKPPYHDIGNDVQVITAISNGVLPPSPVDIMEDSHLRFLTDASSYRFHYLLDTPAEGLQSSNNKPASRRSRRRSHSPDSASVRSQTRGKGNTGQCICIFLTFFGIGIVVIAVVVIVVVGKQSS